MKRLFLLLTLIPFCLSSTCNAQYEVIIQEKGPDTTRYTKEEIYDCPHINDKIVLPDGVSTRQSIIRTMIVQKNKKTREVSGYKKVEQCQCFDRYNFTKNTKKEIKNPEEALACYLKLKATFKEQQKKAKEKIQAKL